MTKATMLEIVNSFSHECGYKLEDVDFSSNDKIKFTFSGNRFSMSNCLDGFHLEQVKENVSEANMLTRIMSRFMLKLSKETGIKGVKISGFKN